MFRERTRGEAELQRGSGPLRPVSAGERGEAACPTFGSARRGRGFSSRAVYAGVSDWGENDGKKCKNYALTITDYHSWSWRSSQTVLRTMQVITDTARRRWDISPTRQRKNLYTPLQAAEKVGEPAGFRAVLDDRPDDERPIETPDAKTSAFRRTKSAVAP
jgi:hypothetical protein